MGDLIGDEEIFAWDLRFSNGAADFLFGPVHFSAIEMVEPFLYGRFDQVQELLVKVRISGFLEPRRSGAQGKLQMIISLEDTLVFCL